MTREELNQEIAYLESSILKKSEQVMRDDKGITRAEEEKNRAQVEVSKAKSVIILKSRQSKLKAKSDDVIRKKKIRDRHNSELISLTKRLSQAKTDLENFDKSQIGKPTIAQSMEKIYQIFVSSTYEDLKSERQEVMAAVVSSGNVPIGMEYFPAGDAAPFDYIRKQIDSADYYILVVAGKYGSINEETGISYTEMEFDYAVSKGVPIAVLQYRNIDMLPGVKLEVDSPEKKKLLDAFRNKTRNNRMVSFWDDIKDLRSQVKDAINNMIKNSPRTGWVRADQAITIREESIDKGVLNKLIPMHYTEDATFGQSTGEDALLPEAICVEELIKIIVPVMRIPKIETAIDDALRQHYQYLDDESIEKAKQMLIQCKLVETKNLVVESEGVYTVWMLTPLAFDLWASIN